MSQLEFISARHWITGITAAPFHTRRNDRHRDSMFGVGAPFQYKDAISPVSVCKFVIGGIGGACQINERPISVSYMPYHGPMKICCLADQLKLS